MEPTENPARKRILARIRSALREASPKHSPSTPPGEIFAPIFDAVDRFERECGENNTECVIVPGPAARAAAVASALSSVPTGEIFAQDSPVLRRMVSGWPEDRRVRWSSEGGPAEYSQATITLAEMLVAQTGSIFVSAACGGRGASVVAPVHIVVACAAQLVTDLATAFARLRERDTAARNSFLCLITGSSRTADIEKTLVLGAHGTRRLVVILSLECEPTFGDNG